MDCKAGSAASRWSPDDPPGTIRLLTGLPEGGLNPPADDDLLLELAAIGARRGPALAGRPDGASIAGIGIAPLDRRSDPRRIGLRRGLPGITLVRAIERPANA